MNGWLDLGNDDYVRASEVIGISDGVSEDEQYNYLWAGRVGRRGKWMGTTLVVLREGRAVVAYRPATELTTDLRAMERTT